MVYLEELDSAHEKELRTVNRQKELVQMELSRIAEQSMDETDPDDYEHFLANLSTLTEKEREIFDLYLENLPGKEIREENGKSPCGMDVADGWKEKRRPAVLHIPVEIRRWNVEKKWKREADGSFGFPPVLWNVESLSTGMCKISGPGYF